VPVDALHDLQLVSSVLEALFYPPLPLHSKLSVPFRRVVRRATLVGVPRRFRSLNR
jgi:hypothetical protein